MVSFRILQSKSGEPDSQQTNYNTMDKIRINVKNKIRDENEMLKYKRKLNNWTIEKAEKTNKKKSWFDQVKTRF